MDSIDESYTENDTDDGSISTTLLRTFGMEVKYIQRLTQEMLYLKYVTILLDKRKMNGMEHNSQKRLWAKV